MERSQQLLKYYRKCMRARALKSWTSTVENNEQFTVLQWIQSFFAYLKKQVEDQVCFNFIILLT